MSRIQNRITALTSICGIIGGLFLLIFTEYKVQSIGILIACIFGATRVHWSYFDPDYKSTRKEGTIIFDYTQNGGAYEIGKEKLLFRLSLSNGDNARIYFNKPSSGIKEIGLATNIYSINDIRDAEKYFTNSTNIFVAEHGIIVMKNVYDNYAAIKILDVKAMTHNDAINEVTFEYLINPDKVSDFG